MAVTPLRRQYLQIKQQHGDDIVLFRLGDFYETFDDDARIAARELGITLTGRDMGKGQRIPMAGIPYHALDSYLGKLISRGYKVAICEQTSDPSDGKGLVDREVVRVVTPGTVVETKLLDQKANNYLASVVVEGELAAVSYVDITTSEFCVTEIPVGQVVLELERLRPSELLFPKDVVVPESWRLAAQTTLDPGAFDFELAREMLLRHFQVATLEGYGCESSTVAIRAAGAIVSYLGATQKVFLGQVTALSTYSTKAYMSLDPQTRRNLDLFEGGRWSARENSLLRVLDLTKTAMGGRLLRKWIGQPLVNREALESRLDVIEWFSSYSLARERTASLLGKVADLERLCNRVRSNIATPKEMVALRDSLKLIPELQAVFNEGNFDALEYLLVRLEPCQIVVDLIHDSIMNDPPVSLKDGGVIRGGFSGELDDLRATGTNAKAYIADLEKTERERSGIKNLKVGYNRVFGYYIEVSKANVSHVPQDYIRKQTLVGGERFITPDLKEYESLVLNAQERIEELEAALFRQVCAQVAEEAASILATAAALAEIDVFYSLAEVAVRYNYTRPVMSDGDELTVVNGRHPVVERNTDPGTFVPNDTHMSNGEAQVLMLTGPNMSGKSTYLRQVGLIVLMAQVGSFVPADSAKIGIVDRVFTRVGLQDDLAAGQSTFMVEMVEMANILNNATARSLIVLDEIGRGTSTYDGLAIARAVAEHIHNHPRLGAKTLFATHYHELTELAESLPRVRNHNVAVSEQSGDVVFLHKIVPGGANKSYGVHVAKLAGIPRPVIARAQEILIVLEDGAKVSSRSSISEELDKVSQISFFNDEPELLRDLRSLDVAALTPLEAITKLFELQQRAEGES